MSELGPAAIRIVRIGGSSIDLRWVRGMIVPPGYQIDVADLGTRAEVSVVRGNEVVGATVDLTTGERQVETTAPTGSSVVRVAMVLLDLLIVGRGVNGADRTFARLRDVVTVSPALPAGSVLRASSAIPLPSRASTVNRPASATGRESDTGRRSVRFRAGRSLRGRARRGHEES